jgi:hypothetical protein
MHIADHIVIVALIACMLWAGAMALCKARCIRPDWLSDYVEIKRFGANPTHVVGDLDCYSMPTSGKFGVFDEYTRRSWPCMCEYSSRDVYSQEPISDTKRVDLNFCIGRGSKPYSDIDW